MQEDNIQNNQDAATPVTNAAVAALVANSLKQQANQFKGIINGLRTQLNNFKDLGKQSLAKTLENQKFPLHLKNLQYPRLHIDAIHSSLLTEFYARFTTAKQVKSAVTDPRSWYLVAQNDILTLRSLKSAGGKVGRACQITALNTFCQLMATSAYDHANVNPSYVNAMSQFINTYNHYVHHYMTRKFKTESKEAGKVQVDGVKKCIQKHRERIREKVLAHSDDEEVPGKSYLISKTLPYQSKNASKFMRRLDIEMKKAADIAGDTIHKRPCRLPKELVPSIFKKAPKNLPIDFYDPKWYRSLHPGQQRLVAQQDQVALLPNASQSLFPQSHPDEKLGDAAFNHKYLDILLLPYVPDDDHEDEADYVGDGDIDEGNDDDTDDVIMSDDKSDFFSGGDFGALCDDDKAA
ncbi:uncharacterized protein MELLADRAFT_67636 [Melampsora larici-populina 98AG31]|uniref:Uncharacterized protein n=1 Tax=Melampsora larici-populina (strain 98AG31 / pathotype 3-4-7) TaxID=747676 RepID=F4S3V9_MELLP|nr:uncharacterized protein MELLADRAFT_67636 [Melampsora larici-populina 98AG31]EGG00601.1 hypothetical protein MELLADRAFT_67636 [Melampsora larici-populina 98AG31]